MSEKDNTRKIKLFPLYYISKSNINMTAAISPNESAKYSQNIYDEKY